jgi:hypothetical protein
MANKVRWDGDWSCWEVTREGSGDIIGFVQWDWNSDIYRVSWGSDIHKRAYFKKFADARAFAKKL